MPASRVVAIDRVKACAIIAVVATHAGPARWSPAWSPLDGVLRGTWTAFHVPAFLIVAGMLYRTDGPMSWADVWRRSVRVLVPYLVVLSMLYATGLAPWPGWNRLPFALVTGESYGILYFVPVLASCLVFAWAFSRLAPAAQYTSVAVLLALTILVAVFRSPNPPWPTFWEIRDPIGRFYFGFFAIGWLGLVPRLAAWQRTCALVALAILALWLAYGVPPFTGPLRLMPLRMAYSVAIVALLWGAQWAFPGMRLLSEASLGIYLLHHPIMNLVAPLLTSQPPPLRFAAFLIVGLGGAAALCLLARVIVGRRTARTWLGA